MQSILTIEKLLNKKVKKSFFFSKKNWTVRSFFSLGTTSTPLSFRNMFANDRTEWKNRCALIANLENINGHFVGFSLGTSFGMNDPGALIFFGGSRVFSFLLEHHRDEFIGHNVFHFASKNAFSLLKWQTKTASITEKLCKMESPICGSGMLEVRPRVSESNKPFAYTILPMIIDGKICLLAVTVKLSPAEAAHRPSIDAYTEALYAIGVRVRTDPRFLSFAHQEFQSFFTEDVLSRFSGFIAPRGLRPQVHNTFIEVIPPVHSEEAPSRLRRSVSCPADVFLYTQTKKEMGRALCAKFRIGHRVHMTGFKNGTWFNGTEGVVISVPPREQRQQRIGVLTAIPNAPRTVAPQHLILLKDEDKTELSKNHKNSPPI